MFRGASGIQAADFYRNHDYIDRGSCRKSLMKEKICLVSVCFVIFIISQLNVYAQKVNWITPEPNFSLTCGATFEAGKDVSPRNLLTDFSAGLNMKELNCFAGFQVQTSVMDFTTSVSYSPTFFDRINMGPKLIFHVQHYDDVYCELDFLGGATLKYALGRKTSLGFDAFFHKKAARIFSITDSVDWLVNDSIAFSTYINFKPVSPLAVNFTVSSFSDYRYMLFLAPDFRLSAEYGLTNTFKLGAEAEIQYIDMFTLSSNLNVVDFRLFCNLRLMP